MIRYIGIDPGSKGAVAILYSDDRVVIEDLDKEFNTYAEVMFRQTDDVGSFEYTYVAVEDVFVEHQVQAIYNTLGQKQAHCVIEHLPQGTYIVVTTSGTYKRAR